MNTTATLPSFQSYGDYSSANYGVNSLQFFTEKGTIWFSYRTVVAFKRHGHERVVRKNEWNTTTGKHLNWIDGGDKASRVDSETFERLYTEQFGS